METAPLLKGSRRRLSDAVKWLPVVFVSTVISGLYLIYMNFHIVPRLAVDTLTERTTRELVFFNLVTALVVVCYLYCIQTEPGGIPTSEEDPSWEFVPTCHAEEGLDANRATQEWKRTGDRRQCKWCAKFKPDRCHHCRVCRTCVLKMDHHCPWIYNCVGFRNHKYFFLFLFYCSLDCHIIAWTMCDSVRDGLAPTTPFMSMFLLLFGETLVIFLGVVLSLFFCFHIYLMVRAMTTVEFCEKSCKRTGYDANVYDRGLLGNVKAVLGEDIKFWLLPMSPPGGRGLVFATDEDAQLGKDAQVSFRG